MKTSSTMLLIPDDGSKQLEAEFTSCVHCGRHWPIAGSIAEIATGKLDLGYCQRCDGIYCPGCSECVPAEQRLENIEQGRPKLYRPVIG